MSLFFTECVVDAARGKHGLVTNDCWRRRPQRSLVLSEEGIQQSMRLLKQGQKHEHRVQRVHRRRSLSTWISKHRALRPLRRRAEKGGKVGTLPQHVDAALHGRRDAKNPRARSRRRQHPSGGLLRSCRKAGEWSGSGVSLSRTERKEKQTGVSVARRHGWTFRIGARGDKTSSPRQRQDWATATQAGG